MLPLGYLLFCLLRFPDRLGPVDLHRPGGQEGGVPEDIDIDRPKGGVPEDIDIDRQEGGVPEDICRY